MSPRLAFYVCETHYEVEYWSEATIDALIGRILDPAWKAGALEAQGPSTGAYGCQDQEVTFCDLGV
jgi:hypothetical protein